MQMTNALKLASWFPPPVEYFLFLEICRQDMERGADCQPLESTHLICNREGGHQLIKNVTRQETRIGGYVGESEVTMGVFSGGASAIPESVTGEEAGHVGRVLLQHAIQPQICDSVAKRAATGKEAAVEAS